MSNNKQIVREITLDFSNAIRSQREFNKELRQQNDIIEVKIQQAKRDNDIQRESELILEKQRNAAENYRKQIEFLRKAQLEMNTDVKEGQQAYDNLGNKISSLTAKLAKKETQITNTISRYKEMYSESNKLKKELELENALYDSNIKKMKAVGDASGVEAAEKAKTINSLGKLNAIRDAEAKKLRTIRAEQGISSDAYKKQSVVMNELAADIGKLVNSHTRIPPVINDESKEYSELISKISEVTRKRTEYQSSIKSTIERHAQLGRSQKADQLEMKAQLKEIKSLKKERKLEEEVLKEVEKQNGRLSDAYKNQENRLNSLNSKISTSTDAYRKMKRESDFKGAITNGLGSISGKLDGISGAATRASSTLSKMLGLDIMKSVFGSSLRKAEEKFKEVAKVGFEGMKLTGTMDFQWDNRVGKQNSKEATNKIKAASKKYTTDLKEVNEAYSAMFGATNNFNKTDDIVKNLLNIGKNNGATQEQISTMLNATVKTVGNTYLQGDELNQLSDSMHGIRQQLAKTKGVDVGELGEIISRRGVSSEDVINTFKRMSEEGGDNTKAAGETLEGAIAIIKNQSKTLSTTLMQSMLGDDPRGLMVNLGEWFNSAEAERNVRDLGLKIHEAIGNVLNAIGLDIKGSNLPELINNIIIKVGDNILKVSNFIKDNKEKIKTGFDSFKKILIAIKDVVIEVAKQIGPYLLQFADWVAKNPEGVKKLVKWTLILGVIGKITGMLGSLVSKIEAVSSAIGGIGRIASKVFPELGPMIGRIAPKAAALAPAAAKLAGGIGSAAVIGLNGKGGWDNAEAIVGKEKAKTKSGKTVAAVSNALAGNEKGSAGNATKNALTYGALGATIGSVIPGLGTAVGGAIGAGLGAATGLAGSKNIAKIFDGETYKKIFSSIGKGWDEYVVKPVKEFFSNIGKWWNEKIHTPLMNGFSNIGKWWNEKIHTPLATFFGNIKTAIMNIPSDISNAFMSVGNFFTDLWAKVVEIFSNITTSIGEFFGRIGESMSNAWQSISSGFNDYIVEPLGRFFSWAWEKLGNVGSWFMDNIVDPIANGFDWLIDKVKELIDHLTNGLDTAKELFNEYNPVALGKKAYNKVFGEKHYRGTNYHKGGRAIVNDETGSNYLESYQLPGSNKIQSFPNIKNLAVDLPAGTKVFNNDTTKSIARAFGSVNNVDIDKIKSTQGWTRFKTEEPSKPEKVEYTDNNNDSTELLAQKQDTTNALLIKLIEAVESNGFDLTDLYRKQGTDAQRKRNSTFGQGTV